MADALICVALLAAGNARRFGGGKLDADCAGKPLGQWAMRAVEAAKIGPQICITGPDAPEFLDGADNWQSVTNSDPSRGLGSSLALAAEKAEEMGADSLLVLLADMPLVSEEFLADLAAQKAPAATEYGSGRLGVPALFPAQIFNELQTLTGDRGAAHLLTSLPDCARMKPPENMLVDVDTLEALQRAAALLRPAAP